MSVCVSINLLACASKQLFLLDTFEINRERAIDYLNTRDNVYVFDGFAGVGFSPVECGGCLFNQVTVGYQIPYQSSGDLRSRVSRSLHGSFCFPGFQLPFIDDRPEQHADPPDGRRAGKLWRT